MESNEVKERVTAANRKLRVEWYREKAPGWWWDFAGKIKAMLGDSLITEDLEDLCFEFFGCNVERMREVLSHGPSFGRTVMPIDEKPKIPFAEWIPIDEAIEKVNRKIKSPAERAKAYRERKKEGK